MKFTKIKTSMVIFLLVSVSFLSLYSPSVLAQPTDTFWVDVEVAGRNVIFVNENVDIEFKSNSSQINLQIYDDAETLVYDNILGSNNSIVFNPSVYGLYTVKGVVGDVIVTTWFWMQNIENLVGFTLPYSWSWKGVDYTLTSEYELHASLNNQILSTEWLSEINSKLKPSTTLLKNSEGICIISDGKDIDATS